MCSVENNRTPQIIVLSHKDFDTFCHNNGYVDETVEKDDTKAFISIENTEECLKYYLEDDESKHWFESDHPNVLNMDFDDLPCEHHDWHGHIFKGMSDEQADRMVEFIERNMEGEPRKDFIIHCRAGISRSQAVGMFLWAFYQEYFYDNVRWSQNSSEHEGYNRYVYFKLRNAYYKKHGSKQFRYETVRLQETVQDD